MLHTQDPRIPETMVCQASEALRSHNRALFFESIAKACKNAPFCLRVHQCNCQLLITYDAGRFFGVDQVGINHYKTPRTIGTGYHGSDYR